MSLRDRVRRLTASSAELDAERLRNRFDDLELTPIGSMGTRRRVKVGGEVVRTRIAPRSGIPSLELVVSDGTGNVIAVFTGRRELGGVEHGRGLVLEGVPYEERGRAIIVNPGYTLLPD